MRTLKNEELPFLNFQNFVGCFVVTLPLSVLVATGGAVLLPLCLSLNNSLLMKLCCSCILTFLKIIKYNMSEMLLFFFHL